MKPTNLRIQERWPNQPMGLRLQALIKSRSSVCQDWSTSQKIDFKIDPAVKSRPSQSVSFLGVYMQGFFLTKHAKRKESRSTCSRSTVRCTEDVEDSDRIYCDSTRSRTFPHRQRGHRSLNLWEFIDTWGCTWMLLQHPRLGSQSNLPSTTSVTIQYWWVMSHSYNLGLFLWFDFQHSKWIVSSRQPIPAIFNQSDTTPENEDDDNASRIANTSWSSSTNQIAIGRHCFNRLFFPSHETNDTEAHSTWIPHQTFARIRSSSWIGARRTANLSFS